MMRNGVPDMRYLTRLESAGDYLIVMPATSLIGFAGSQWIASGLLDSLHAIAREFKRRSGNPLVVTEAFRSLGTQEEYKRRERAGTGNRAATPGYSNHGLGIALDLASGIGHGGTPFRLFSEIAAQHGWSNEEGASVGEKWHWTGAAKSSTAGGAPVPFPISDPYQEEEDMTPEQDARMKNIEKILAVDDGGGIRQVVRDTLAHARSADAKADTIGQKIDRVLAGDSPWLDQLTVRAQKAAARAQQVLDGDSDFLRQLTTRAQKAASRAAALLKQVPTLDTDPVDPDKS